MSYHNIFYHKHFTITAGANITTYHLSIMEWKGTGRWHILWSTSVFDRPQNVDERLNLVQICTEDSKFLKIIILTVEKTGLQMIPI
jgi:hypothetical protein